MPIPKRLLLAYAVFSALLVFPAILRAENATPGPSETLPANAPPNFLPGQLLVKFRADTSMERLVQMSEGAGFLVKKQLTPWGLFLVVFSERIPVGEMQARLGQFPAVLYAEPNYKIAAFQTNVSGTSSAAFAGQAAPAGVVVAVLDAGFEIPAPEGTTLRIHQNQGEIPDDGLDNDGNGYVDDVAGYDFFDGDNSLQGQAAFKNTGMTLIQAVCEGAHDKPLVLLPLRVGPGPWLLTSSVCEAISYAISRGAAVVNLSFGGWWSSQALLETTAFAAEKNVILIAAAGHENEDWPALLKKFPQVIWVSSVQEDNWKTWLLFNEKIPMQRLELPKLSDVTDLTASGSHLLNHQNVSSVKGKVNEAARFLRSKKQYLQSPDVPALSMGGTDFTLAAWVYLDSKEEVAFLSKGDTSHRNGNEYYLRYHPSVDCFEFMVGNPIEKQSGSVSANSYGSPPTGTWCFLVAWFDRATRSVHIQVNQGPVEANLGKAPSDSFDSPLEFTIGRYSDWDGAYADGRIDEVGVWKRVLSDEERADLYNNGKGNSYRLETHSFQIDRQNSLTQGLAAYYPLDVSNRYRWQLGRITADPLDLIGLLGFGLFFFSSIQSIGGRW